MAIFQSPIRFSGPVAALVLLLAVGPLSAQTAGDLNGDGKVDRADLGLLEQYLDGSGLLDGDQSARADLNGDGVVNSKDANRLRQQLGIATVDEPTLNGRASSDRANSRRGGYRASASSSAFQLGVADVVPEWVRGSWRFQSQIYDARGGFGGGNNYQSEQLSLPGDLSKLYSTYKVQTGERLDRLCWQVNDYSDARFSFTEQLRDQGGAVYASTADILNRGPGQAEIRIRVEVLDAGSGQGGGGLLGGLFGFLFNGGRPMGSLSAGDYYVRGGPMERVAGSERTRLPDVDLASLRCR
ncbi:dockerin type I repeat-containing protein [Gloeobacter kilaueensis]|uniref:Dockerin domain-containing protein n=1 Tax=Gloeobacter kilaueensis (strain ATCC BAA-2537 / CCAP 1431/1 / ULC 316 / JS1) TaxID=1183438 RepID=U5QHB1_GLOK1|nr:dockerin type I repeat-containing protein [Gloeobacter kilaueensis]AGY58337.1 hypothetical protein GKIL_2091 [Gloeobacter kilaueensis JS1]